MWIGWIEFDLLLGDVRSLKQKRAVIRPILAQLRRFELTASEVGDQDLHRRARLGAAIVTGDAAYAQRVLDAAERAVAEHPETQLLGIRRRLANSAD